MGALRAQAVAGVALLALAAQSGPASADGPVGRPEDPYRYTPYDPAPPAFLVFNWSGFYIGGNVGWGYTSAESTFQVENALTDRPRYYRLPELRADRVVPHRRRASRLATAMEYLGVRHRGRLHGG